MFVIISVRNKKRKARSENIILCLLNYSLITVIVIMCKLSDATLSDSKSIKRGLLQTIIVTIVITIIITLLLSL